MAKHRNLNKELVVLEVPDLDRFNDYDEAEGYGHAKHLDLDDNHIVVKKADEQEFRDLINTHGQSDEDDGEDY